MNFDSSTPWTVLATILTVQQVVFGTSVDYLSNEKVTRMFGMVLVVEKLSYAGQRLIEKNNYFVSL
jgi:hypothetical protein